MTKNLKGQKDVLCGAFKTFCRVYQYQIMAFKRPLNL